MNAPVFLKAIPRCGGTLLVTMLDAHPEIAMSYEIYERNLFNDVGLPLEIDGMLCLLRQARGKADNDIQWIKQIPDNNLRTFLYRARRGGLDVDEIMDELIASARNNTSLNTEGRLDFIDTLMKRKMLKTDKTFWGGKTQADLYALYERHPKACFFIMVRDIRDVFASMLNRGSFTYTAAEAARLWRDNILDFREFVSRHKPNAIEVCYEDLTREPERMLTKVCQHIGVEFRPDILSYHKKDMTLFKNPHGHLSYEQLRKGLNQQSIGRWRRDLKTSDIDSILATAGDLLVE